MFVWMMEITQLDRRYKSTHVLHLCSSWETPLLFPTPCHSHYPIPESPLVNFMDINWPSVQTSTQLWKASGRYSNVVNQSSMIEKGFSIFRKIQDTCVKMGNSKLFDLVQWHQNSKKSTEWKCCSRYPNNSAINSTTLAKKYAAAPSGRHGHCDLVQ